MTYGDFHATGQPQSVTDPTALRSPATTSSSGAVGAGVEDPELIDYGGLDRRDSRRVETSSGTRTRDFSYIGTTEQLSREVEPGGDRRFYDYDSVGDRQGQTVSKPSGTTTYRGYTKDANGSVMALETGAGTIIQNSEYVYDPYGELDATRPMALSSGGPTPISSRIGRGETMSCY